MATIKSYTDLSQSRKLAEILPLESADMHYPDYYFDGNAKGSCNTPYKEAIEDLLHVYINPKTKRLLPCWSLAALFAVLPNKIVSHETAFEGEDAEGINDTYNKRVEPTEDGRYTCCYVGNGCIYECVAGNPVDACCDMIIKLSELNLL